MANSELIFSGSFASNKTIFGRLVNLTITAATWSALLYGLYNFYEKYLKKCDKTQEALQEDIQEMAKEMQVLRAKLSHLIRTVNSVHEFIGKYLGKRDDNLLLLKKELSSIKSLLVSRSQFSDVPVIPKIPAWQIEASTNKRPNSLSDVSAGSSDESANQKG